MFLILVIPITLLSLSQEVIAHPGNTDDFGKHTCRTNCGKWGLEYGEYHGHDGGDSSSTSSSGGTSIDSTYPDEFPLMNEQELEIYYEELQNDGFDIGYEDGYNDEKFIDFHDEIYAQLSNAEYSWYEVGYENGYKEGQAKRVAETNKKQEDEYQVGEELGNKQGKLDFENKTVKETAQTDSSQTEHWNDGYGAGYKKTVQLMQLVVQAKEEGYQQGLTHEKISIPSIYGSEEVKQAFEEGFKIGEDKRIKQLQESYVKEGYEAGYNLRAFTTSNVPELYKLSFKEGFENGYNAKEDEAYQQGYNIAYKTIKYQTNDQYKEYSNLQKQHKNGFEANNEAVELREEASESGKSGERLTIPDNIESNNDAVVLYNNYYEKGKEERDVRNKQILISGLILVPIGTVGGYYLNRRRLKKL